MTIKVFAAAAALTLLPTLSLAMGCNYDKQASMTCSDGTKFDAASGTCVAVSS